MRIVCDTNCLVSGLIWTVSPAQILKRVAAGSDLLFTSRILLHELARVLGYSRVRKILKRRGLKSDELLKWVVTNSTLLVPKPLPEVAVLKDPEDDNVLACAVSAAVDAIVSGDGHVLDLGTFDGIPVLTPAAFLKNAKTG